MFEFRLMRSFVLVRGSGESRGADEIGLGRWPCSDDRVYVS